MQLMASLVLVKLAFASLLLTCTIAEEKSSDDDDGLPSAEGDALRLYVDNEWTLFSKRLTTQTELDVYMIVLVTSLWQHALQHEPNANPAAVSQTEIVVRDAFQRLNLWPTTGQPTTTFNELTSGRKCADQMTEFRLKNSGFFEQRRFDKSEVQIASELVDFYSKLNVKCSHPVVRHRKSNYCTYGSLIADLVEQCAKKSSNEQVVLRIKAHMISSIWPRYQDVMQYLGSWPAESPHCIHAFEYGKRMSLEQKMGLVIGLVGFGAFGFMYLSSGKIAPQTQPPINSSTPPPAPAAPLDSPPSLLTAGLIIMLVIVLLAGLCVASGTLYYKKSLDVHVSKEVARIKRSKKKRQS